MRTFHKGIFFEHLKYLPLLGAVLYLGYRFGLFNTPLGPWIMFTCGFLGFVSTFLFPLFFKAGKRIPEKMKYIVHPGLEVTLREIEHRESETIVLFVEAKFESHNDLRKGILPTEQYDLRVHRHYVVGKDYQLYLADNYEF